MALFQDGKPVYMLHRRDIESRDANQIAGILTEAFERHCTPTAV
jgi:putative YphP/YqiW family bacilliredoxin